MSLGLGRRLNGMASLPETEVKTVREQFGSALQRMEIVALDCYDKISVLSVHWKSDLTGGDKDSALFIKTVSKLENTDARIRILGDNESVTAFNLDVITQANSLAGRRKLFIFHYAGHAIASAPSNALVLTSRIAADEFNGPQMSMTYIKDGLMYLAADTEGLDILIVLDCCCAAIAGRGSLTGGKRVELMAATSAGGLSNSREDHPELTFTQRWCTAFEKFLDLEHPFDCDDLKKAINIAPGLEQFPATYILREGGGIPIKFRALPAASTPAVETVITALHIEENPNSLNVEDLIVFLENAPVRISVLAALPAASTLLLLHVPQILQELLKLPQVTLIVLPTGI